jgi:hypothetical protein
MDNLVSAAVNLQKNILLKIHDGDFCSMATVLAALLLGQKKRVCTISNDKNPFLPIQCA